MAHSWFSGALSASVNSASRAPMRISIRLISVREARSQEGAQYRRGRPWVEPPTGSPQNLHSPLVMAFYIPNRISIEFRGRKKLGQAAVL
jgi:hypothetical protein